MESSIRLYDLILIFRCRQFCGWYEFSAVGVTEGVYSSNKKCIVVTYLPDKMSKITKGERSTAY